MAMAPTFDFKDRLGEARQKRRDSRDEARQKDMDLKYFGAREKYGKFSTSHIVCYECQTSHHKSCFTFKYNAWGRKSRICLVGHLGLWIAPGVTAGFSDIEELRNTLLIKESREVECASGSRYWSRWVLDPEGRLILSTHISLGLFVSLGNLSKALKLYGLYPVCKHKELDTLIGNICSYRRLTCTFEKSDAESKASSQTYPFEVAQVLSECPCHVPWEGLYQPWRCQISKRESCGKCVEDAFCSEKEPRHGEKFDRKKEPGRNKQVFPKEKSAQKDEPGQKDDDSPLDKGCKQLELCGAQFSLLLYRSNEMDEERGFRRVALHIQRDFGNLQSLTAETWIHELLESGVQRVAMRFQRNIGGTRALTTEDCIHQLLEPQDHQELSADWARGERFVDLSSAIEERRMRLENLESCGPFEFLPEMESKASLLFKRNAEYGGLYRRSLPPPPKKHVPLVIPHYTPMVQNTAQKSQAGQADAVAQRTSDFQTTSFTAVASPIPSPNRSPTLSVRTRSLSSQGADHPMDPPSPPTTTSSIASTVQDAASVSSLTAATKRITKPRLFRRCYSHIKRAIQKFRRRGKMPPHKDDTKGKGFKEVKVILEIPPSTPPQKPQLQTIGPPAAPQKAHSGLEPRSPPRRASPAAQPSLTLDGF